MKKRIVDQSNLSRGTCKWMLSATALLTSFLSGCGGGGSSEPAVPVTTGTNTEASTPKIPDDSQLPATTTVAKASYAGQYADLRAQAVDHLNELRGTAGLGLLSQDTRLDQSAQWHSDKKYQKHENPFDETDKDLATRVSRFGYPYQSVFEVLDFDYWRSGAEVVDGHLNSIYHRIPLLSYRFVNVGVGANTWTSAGEQPRSMTTIHLANTGTAKQGAPNTPYVVWPRDGTTVPEVNMTAESPNPPVTETRAAQMEQPFGYPISVNVDDDKTLDVSSFELLDEQGRTVPGIVLSRESDPNLLKFQAENWAFFVPKAWLPQSTTYTARFKGASVHRGVRSEIAVTWSFRTPERGFTAYSCGVELFRQLYEDDFYLQQGRNRGDLSWLPSFEMNCSHSSRSGPQWFPSACLAAIEARDLKAMTASCQLYKNEPWRGGRPATN